MSALKSYQRDRDLPARLGDEKLKLPSDDEFLGLVARHLCAAPNTPRPVQASLAFARWKPATALLGSWSVRFEDDSQCTLSLKTYAGSKAQMVADSFHPNEHMHKAAAPLLPVTYLEDRGALLSCFPADRVLRGAARVVDLRRTGRALDDAGLWPGKVFRRRSSRIELLRYKPERRAVLALHAKLKRRTQAGAEPAGEVRLAVRVLDPEAARRQVARRAQGPAGVLPRLVHTELEAGLLFEEWIEGEPVATGDFSQAAASATVIAALHGHGAEGPSLQRDRSSAQELFARLAGLDQRLEALGPAPMAPARCWIHGDFHADQLTRHEGGLRLLDGDDLRPGAAEEDLANWIADRLAQDPEMDMQSAADELFAGYGAGPDRLDLALLRALSVEELLNRAAAGLRRLEVRAEERARGLVERAHACASETLKA
ncbi:MAG: hypothetical protein ABGY71_01485 [bacterium]|nr:hypothetical protein [Planctomycetota bacterium]HIL51550.1 hypothetical protein [Planctomycetota bacterium]